MQLARAASPPDLLFQEPNLDHAAIPFGQVPQRHARDGRHALLLERLARQGRERRRVAPREVEAQRLLQLGRRPGRLALALGRRRSRREPAQSQRPAAPAALPARGHRALRAAGLLGLDGVQAQQRRDGGGRARGPARRDPRAQGGGEQEERRRRRCRVLLALALLAGRGLRHLPLPGRLRLRRFRRPLRGRRRSDDDDDGRERERSRSPARLLQPLATAARLPRRVVGGHRGQREGQGVHDGGPAAVLGVEQEGPPRRALAR